MYWQKTIVFLFGILFLSCARIVMPSGGPADTTPPKVKISTPVNYSTHFEADKISILFDEYIVLKDFNQEFVSSPLFKDKPQKVLKGKSIILKFDKDSLEPNTTYTLNFGNSIAGFRAGNVLEQFQYVFSTGDIIDSLHISGHLYWAEDLSPKEKIWVLLYKNFNDSILRTQRPDFVAKTDKDGFFSINNIAEGEYYITALKDINSNYIFDLPNEQIAFLDSTFSLSVEENEETDSLKLDSNSTAKPYRIFPEQIDLFLFEEEFSNQYLSEYTRNGDYEFNLIFNEPYDTNLTLRIDQSDDKQWIVEPSLNKDTFNIWLIDTNLAKRDTLTLFLDYYKTNDSTHVLSFYKDTLVFQRKAQEKTNDRILDLKSNISEKHSFDFYKTPYIRSTFPLRSVDLSKIKFYKKIDTTFTLVNTVLSPDSLNARQYNIDYPLEENTEYKIYIEPKAFTDYRTFSNDTIEHVFKTTSTERYTEIILKVQGVQQDLIVQLLDNKNNCLRESFLKTDSALTFKYLKPINYKLKIIEDTNSNKQWDTGNYNEKRQAEKVYFYTEPISTKANWSHDITWDLSKPNN